MDCGCECGKSLAEAKIGNALCDYLKSDKIGKVSKKCSGEVRIYALHTMLFAYLEENGKRWGHAFLYVRG